MFASTLIVSANAMAEETSTDAADEVTANIQNALQSNYCGDKKLTLNDLIPDKQDMCNVNLNFDTDISENPYLMVNTAKACLGDGFNFELPGMPTLGGGLDGFSECAAGLMNITGASVDGAFSSLMDATSNALEGMDFSFPDPQSVLNITGD